jgi:type VI secretion system secreted protein Hcp
MRPCKRLRYLALSATLGLLVASPAYAAVNSYMRIEGTKQGAFKGETAHKGSDQWIPIVQFNQSMPSPRDNATGQASGKRRHEPIKITKEWGAASPQLQRALASNEMLKEVVFEFVRTNARGQEEVYETIKLTNALVIGIQRGAGQRTGKNSKELEEVSFTYEKIEISHANGKTTATDDWQRPR